ncbi:MAG: DUF2961 domain-containing protein [Clostridiales bacterium]|jgi:hypothetical protein|nr:DUF2961 domain-containing protein [Clostridiales bacterium]
MSFDGLSMNMGTIHLLSDAKSRSLSAENITGEPGKGAMCPLEEGISREAARDLGFGWKVNPAIRVAAGQIATVADVDGPGCIQHIWMTITGKWRNTILRIYWDGEEIPAVECPVGDFFCSGWNEYSQLSSLAVCVNPGSAFNCYWPMPFRKHCKITLENRSDNVETYFYQIDYTLTQVPEDAAYFHAYFNRSNPLPYKQEHCILPEISGKGHYVGTYMAWGVNNNGWWGEGEIKFFMDSDKEHPTICGTGTEDYFCGSYDFEDPKTHDRYVEFSTPYTGLHQVITPNKLYNSQFRFGLYRWHILDPIRFDEKLRATIQALGWRSGGRYLPLRDDISSVAFWYQISPAQQLSPLPGRDDLEVI